MRSQAFTGQSQTLHPQLIVEMSREPGGDHFSCTVPDWNFLSELATTFGWRPIGTIYLPQHGQPARDKPIKHDYRPGDSQDRKRVEANDSAHWAAALQVARQSPFITGILQARVRAVGGDEQTLQRLLQDFVRFAHQGAFTIALRREL